MILLQMSIRGFVMILAVIVIRALLLNKLPKKTFLILWGIALLRLTVPFSVSSELSVYSLLQRNPRIMETLEEKAYAGQRASDLQNIPAGPDAPEAEDTAGISEAESMPNAEAIAGGSAFGRLLMAGMASGRKELRWAAIWLTGFLVCAGYFILSYFKWRREFRFSRIVTNETAAQWLAVHPLKRRIEIRQSGRISTPLTYGLISPVILLPETIRWEEGRELAYVLEHEFVHIRRLDGAAKFFLTAGLCIHWFNPLVWVMYILANRDLELSCDETVVRCFGEDSRASYARTLIHMEEEKSALMPVGSNFSRNAIEERITAIMKIKKASLITISGAAILILGVVFFFATSAEADPEPEELTALNDEYTDGYADGYTAQEDTDVPYGDAEKADEQQKEQQSGGALPDESLSGMPKNESEAPEDSVEEREGAQKVTVQVSAGIAASASPEVEWFFSSGGEKSKFFWYTITNDTDKTITGIEYGMLAYDSGGNPLKIYWNPLDSSKTSSYSCTVKDNDILLGPGEAVEHERTIFDVDSFWSLIELREGAEYRIDMVLYGIRQIEFEDGTVWENPEYEDWIQNCRGKMIPSSLYNNDVVNQDYYLTNFYTLNNKRRYSSFIRCYS